MNYNMPMATMGRSLPMIGGLRQEDFPDLPAMEVGGTRYVVLKLELVAKRSGKAMGLDDRGDQKMMEGDFQINSIKILGKEPVDAKSLESKEFQAVTAKVLSGQM
ncbi:MAG TPA: hypothetical protein VIJ25_07205 [Methylococcales bacterium]